MHESINVQLTQEDLLRLQFSFLARQTYTWVLLLFFIGAILNIVAAIVDGDITSVNPIMILFFIFVPLIVFLTIRSSRKSIQNKFVKETKTYTWSDEGLFMESESMTARIMWADFTNAITTKSAIYLMVSHNAAHALPRRCFTQEQWIHFRKITKSRIKRKNKYKWVRNAIIYLVIFLVTVGIVQYYAAN
ncbi:YcxB family protein [Paenibacillus sp. YAF4_2]|uniref:YcxB family protein n=1 Tax=Paenibacillus sp. YAF4_2 TaxID=3233085 RepID=UPI003F9820B6